MQAETQTHTHGHGPDTGTMCGVRLGTDSIRRHLSMGARAPRDSSARQGHRERDGNVNEGRRRRCSFNFLSFTIQTGMSASSSHFIVERARRASSPLGGLNIGHS